MSDSGGLDATRSRVARSILQKNFRLRRGENVTIEGWTHNLPWAVAFAREARRQGARPLVLYNDEGAFWDAIEHHDDKTIGAAPTHEWAALQKTNVYIHLQGPGDRARYAAIPEARHERLIAYNDHWYETSRKAGVRGARPDLARPHPTLAKLYHVEQSAWQDQLNEACMADPAKLGRSSASIARAIQKGRKVRITDDHGTDLRLGLLRRKPVVALGDVAKADLSTRYSMMKNLPAGLIRVALDEKVADGTLVANRSNYYDTGTAEGGVLHFSNGRLTEATFASGGDQFEKPYKKAGKGRDQPGILSIGLNPGLHNTPQMEDIEQGAVLVSVGGNRFVGGKNQSNHFGFAITAGATVEIDGHDLPIPG